MVCLRFCRPSRLNCASTAKRVVLSKPSQRAQVRQGTQRGASNREVHCIARQLGSWCAIQREVAFRKPT